jgi:hypothetical protein
MASPLLSDRRTVHEFDPQTGSPTEYGADEHAERSSDRRPVHQGPTGQLRGNTMSNQTIAALPAKGAQNADTINPGSHPVAVGVGAAVTGAATGFAAGMAAGPVGAVVGAVAGGVAGGYLGKAAAEEIGSTPDNDLGHKFATRPRLKAGEMPNPHLATYLQDHLAESVLAIELLQHLEAAHNSYEICRTLTGLRADIAADRGELEKLMGDLSVSVSATHSALAWLGEKVARLKMRIDDDDTGSFHLLEAVELVAIGIDGKRALWMALAHVSEYTGRLVGPDYAKLIQRAAEQRERIEGVRLEAARAALA